MLFRSAIGALSLKCRSLRKVSVAIIGLFVTALDRQDARSSVSWHYRPQIGMLLHSIQRSLVLRLCHNVNTKNNLDEAIDDVPQLPGFSAIFLARASIILSHPADPLYGAINRAFLRSEEDAGAFQDLTRLPVFVALFCSSADTPEQLTAERRFALNLVKEGFTEANEYRLLTQCHCPELMLTSIDFALTRSSFGFDDDLPALFLTLTHVIASGADRAASHLINRLGLLAWARAFMVEKSVFPNLPVYVAYLKMLAALLNLGYRHDNVESMLDFIAATRGIAQCVLAFALEYSCNEQTTNRSRTTVGPVLHYTCEIIFILSQAQIAANGDTPAKDGFQIHCQPDGIQFDLALRFVEELRPHHLHHFSKAIVAMFILPIESNADNASSLKQMCKILIDEYRTLNGQTNASKCAIFLRLCFMTQSITSVLDDTNDVLQCLLLWRSDCANSIQLRQVWHEIMKLLVPVRSHEEVDFSMCTMNKSLLPAFILQREAAPCKPESCGLRNIS